MSRKKKRRREQWDFNGYVFCFKLVSAMAIYAYALVQWKQKDKRDLCACVKQKSFQIQSMHTNYQMMNGSVSVFGNVHTCARIHAYCWCGCKQPTKPHRSLANFSSRRSHKWITYVSLQLEMAFNDGRATQRRLEMSSHNIETEMTLHFSVFRFHWAACCFIGFAGF